MGQLSERRVRQGGMRKYCRSLPGRNIVRIRFHLEIQGGQEMILISTLLICGITLFVIYDLSAEDYKFSIKRPVWVDLSGISAIVLIAVALILSYLIQI